MEITRRAVDGWTELTIIGRLDGYWADHLDAGLTEAVREGHHQLRLDLSSVTFVSSAGIGVLVKFYKRLDAIQGALVIVRASEPVRTVLDMTRLSAMLIDDTPDDPGTLTLGSTRRPQGARAASCSSSRPARRWSAAIGGEHASARRQIVRWRRSSLSCPASPIAVGIGAFGAATQTACTASASSSPSAARRRTCPPTAPTCPTTWWRRTPKRPSVRVSRGLVCDGAFAHHLRFE